MSLSLFAARHASDEWSGVEHYHAQLVKYLSLGGSSPCGLVHRRVRGFSERRRGVRLASQFGAVLIAALALWAALVVGVHVGYGEWQSAPNAGDRPSLTERSSLVLPLRVDPVRLPRCAGLVLSDRREEGFRAPSPKRHWFPARREVAPDHSA